MKKQTFALYFGNRGFMPAELIASAREDMVKAVTDAGFILLWTKTPPVTAPLKPAPKAEFTPNGLKATEANMTV